MAADPTATDLAAADPAPAGAASATPPPEVQRATAWQARCLLRSARSGCLATNANGQPYASLVTPACMPDGSLLLLLSRLAEHTRHLMADPKCSVMVAGAAVSANPQTTPRVTVTGVAEVVHDPALKARYLAVHRYAVLYAEFTDFATWRIQPTAGLLVGGFARAFRLKPADLAPDPAAVAAILAAEPGILSHCNRDHADALALLAGSAGAWRMVTADVEGFDLALDEQVLRFAWSGPVQNSSDVRRELVRMVQTVRGGS